MLARNVSLKIRLLMTPSPYYMLVGNFSFKVRPLMTPSPTTWSEGISPSRLDYCRPLLPTSLHVVNELQESLTFMRLGPFCYSPLLSANMIPFVSVPYFYLTWFLLGQSLCFYETWFLLFQSLTFMRLGPFCNSPLLLSNMVPFVWVPYFHETWSLLCQSLTFMRLGPFS